MRKSFNLADANGSKVGTCSIRKTRQTVENQWFLVGFLFADHATIWGYLGHLAVLGGGTFNAVQRIYNTSPAYRPHHPYLQTKMLPYNQRKHPAY